MIPPAEANGHWVVCDSCGWERTGVDALQVAQRGDGADAQPGSA